MTRFAFIDREKAHHDVAVLCRLLKVSRSGFYAWLSRPPSARAVADEVLTVQIRTDFDVNRRVYGAPRIHAELAEAGVLVGRKRVARLMRQAEIVGCHRRKRSFAITRQDPQADAAPDRVDRKFVATAPNQLWVADVTYVPTVQGWLYLACVTDVFSRMVIGLPGLSWYTPGLLCRAPPTHGWVLDMIACRSSRGPTASPFVTRKTVGVVSTSPAAHIERREFTGEDVTVTRTVPGLTTPPTLRVASVPAEHVYVRHLGAVDGTDRVCRLSDPVPDDPDPAPGQWWPPRMLSPEWIRENRADFDVMHVQFGFDAQSAQALAALVAELRRWDKRLVYTAHDLRNPHHIDRRAHDDHLDVLVPAADEVITLTRGAAAEISRRWGRKPVVLPHPHVIEFERFRPRRNSGDEWTVGVHAKSVRASMAPLPVIAALADVVRQLPGAGLQVNVHNEVADVDGARHDPVLMRWLREAESSGALELVVHDCFSDEELWRYLESLDLSVLPYRFGTHSGWLEACFDLGTTVLAPTCGFFAQQRPSLTYRHDEQGLDVPSLQAAVRTAYEQRPLWQASLADRRQERADLAAAHRAVYDAVLR